MNERSARLVGLTVSRVRGAVYRILASVLRKAEHSDHVAVALWRDLVPAYQRPARQRDQRADFLAFCRAHGSIGRGQLFQDLWVLFETEQQLAGYFVEFGAVDGLAHSNTLVLERQFGWRGILAEPNPYMVKSLEKNRVASIDTRCVWSKSDELVELLVTPDPEFSTLVSLAKSDQHFTTERMSGEMHKVLTVSLADLLEQHDAPLVIDYMSVDTEGSEYEILTAFPFGSRTIRLLSIEHNHRPIECDLDRLMATHGYERRFPELSGWDAWYRLRTVVD
jgi:FkbM family methyltransferase